MNNKQSLTQVILDQIKEGEDDLRSKFVNNFDWYSLTESFACRVVPIIEEQSNGLKDYVEGVLNAPLRLRRAWREIRSKLNSNELLINEFEKQLQFDEVLRDSVTGETISKVVTKFLLKEITFLRPNGSSDFPDLYAGDIDYSFLPDFSRKAGSTFGPARKGSEKRPVRVPNGLEIKTCRDNIRVDCHHPHPGLHLALVYSKDNDEYKVNSVSLGFLRNCDYRESGRNTTATTVKYSFNSRKFINASG